MHTAVHKQNRRVVLRRIHVKRYFEAMSAGRKEAFSIITVPVFKMSLLHCYSRVIAQVYFFMYT